MNIAGNYASIQYAFKRLDSSRAQIYAAYMEVEVILDQLGAQWKGPDAEAYINGLREVFSAVNNYTKDVLNEFTWQLKVYVEEMVNQSQQGAAEAPRY